MFKSTHLILIRLRFTFTLFSLSATKRLYSNKRKVRIFSGKHKHFHRYYSPALKKLGFTGFVLPFRHSVRLSFQSSVLPSSYQIYFRRAFLKSCKGCKVETWYTHTQWVDVSCILESGVTSLDRFNHLPLMKKFGDRFLRNYESCKLETWYTMKVVNLKRGTHMDNGLMCRVYRNQLLGPITFGVASFDRFYNLPLMKNFRSRFLRNCRSRKIETWYTHGQ